MKTITVKWWRNRDFSNMMIVDALGGIDFRIKIMFSEN